MKWRCVKPVSGALLGRRRRLAPIPPSCCSPPTLLCLGVACGLLTACGSGAKGPLLPRAAGDASPIAPALGLGVALWTLDDLPSQTRTGAPGTEAVSAGAGRATRDVLAEFCTLPPPAPQATLAAWSRAGLRVLACPAERLGDLRAALGAVGPPRVTQMMFAPAWSVAAQGPAGAGVGALQTGEGIINVDRLTPTLWVRGWPVPAVGGGRDAQRAGARVIPAAALVELRPGLVPRGRRESGPFAGEAPESAGEHVTLASLLMQLTVDAGTAVVVVPEGGEPSGVDPNPQGQGPEVPEVARLGEAILSDALAPPRTGERTILVLVASPPAEYRLLP